MRRTVLGLLLILSLAAMAGCDTALTVGTKTIGIRSGELIYTDGFLRATYTSSFDKVMLACERALTGMRAADVERTRKIAQGSFKALVQEEKVRISVDYVEKELTAVSVMAGTGGNTLASQLIHDRIATALKTAP
jgi:hypothetical protein